MLDLSLFRRPAMIGVSETAFTLAGSIFALFLYLTLYIQDDLGYGPLQAGLRFLPITLMSFLVAPVAGKMTVRIQARYLLGTGLLLVGVGQLLMGRTTATSSWIVLLPGFLVAGAGIGMVNPVLASSAIAVVPPERSGMASGINSTFRQVGIATGIAGLGAIFQSQIKTKVIAALGTTEAGRAAAQHAGQIGPALTSGNVQSAVHGLPSAQGAALLAAYREGFSHTINELLLIGGILALVGSALAYILVRQRDFVGTGQRAAPAAAQPAPTTA